jgi:hypothetical protein
MSLRHEYFLDRSIGFLDWFKIRRCGEILRVVVEKVNPAPTPFQYRLLCKLTTKWQPNFYPFAGFEYQSLAKQLVQAK